MDRRARAPYIGAMDIGTLIFTWMHGRQVGRDEAGNRYFEERRPRGERVRRWVLYAGAPDASAVPPEWHAWLHHTADTPLADPKRTWQAPHRPNPTGTPAAYRPAGHDYAGGVRRPATGDYEAWTPGT
jgi:NADH:ubiquinone oxidoreductase subunit